MKEDHKATVHTIHIVPSAAEFKPEPNAYMEHEPAIMPAPLPEPMINLERESENMSD